MDINTKELIYQKNNPFKNTYPILTDTEERYFFGNGKIYEFDDQINDYKLLTSTKGLNNPYKRAYGYYKGDKYSDYYYYKSYKYKDYLLFEDSENNILLFNTKTKENKSFKNVEYHTFDNDIIYLITYSNMKVKIEEIHQ